MAQQTSYTDHPLPSPSWGSAVDQWRASLGTQPEPATPAKRAPAKKAPAKKAPAKKAAAKKAAAKKATS